MAKGVWCTHSVSFCSGQAHTGAYTKIRYPQVGNNDRHVEITTNNGYAIQEMYVEPNSDLTVGDKVQRGGKIGEAQSLQRRYSRTAAHVHVEIKKDVKVILRFILEQKLRLTKTKQ